MDCNAPSSHSEVTGPIAEAPPKADSPLKLASGTRQKTETTT